MIIKYIEEKANDLLFETNLNQAPIKIDKLAKVLGINLESAELDNEISGLLVIKDGNSFIRYNKNETLQRRRFTIAHEIGHFVFHSKNTPLFIDKTKVMYRNPDSSSGEFMKEREANSFAAAILMPKPLIEKELNKIKKGDIISALAKIFNVSSQAMSFRLSNLGYDFGLF